jgi:acylpyruvate hydrolase
MQLATLNWNGGSAAALRVDDGFRPIAGFPDVGALVASGPNWEDAARSNAAADVIPHEEATLHRPVLEPGAVVCVGVNFRAHVLEMGAELPDHPTLFSKLPRALTDPNATIRLPAAASGSVDYEGELAVVIGSGGRDIGIDDAWDAVAGLTIANDVSMRDYQFRSPQWFAGKTWESSTPVGPTLVTLDEVGDVSELELRVEVNGELRQRSSLGDLIFSIPELVADVSQIVTLQPGDLLLTGTPGGVAHAMEPPEYLRDDDLVAVTIDRLGTLSNRVRAATLTAIGDETQDH